MPNLFLPKRNSKNCSSRNCRELSPRTNCKNFFLTSGCNLIETFFYPITPNAHLPTTPKEIIAAYEKYGVEVEVVAAILRIETNFGGYTGTRSVFNTLYTRYILEARRRKEALIQIEYFLRITRIGEEDPFALKGSSWGAFGLPQFMPYSYWHFAVDGNTDGVIDLFDPADAIDSAANYLREHGWSDKEKDRKNAVWAYNHDYIYVKAVLAYFNALKKSRQDTEEISSPETQQNSP